MSFTVRFGDGDLEIGSTGEQTLITGAEKAAQDLLDEVLLPYDATRDRGNELFEANGELTSIVGSTSIASGAIWSFIKSAVKRLQRAQRFDPGTSRTELIQRISSLLVQPVNNNVTSYAFLLAVVVDDENIAVARAISMRHLGDTPTPLVGGHDP